MSLADLVVLAEKFKLRDTGVELLKRVAEQK